MADLNLYVMSPDLRIVDSLIYHVRFQSLKIKVKSRIKNPPYHNYHQGDAWLIDVQNNDPLHLYWLCQEIRSHRIYGQVPLILHLESPDPELKKNLMTEFEFLWVVDKPVDPVEFLQALQQVGKLLQEDRELLDLRCELREKQIDGDFRGLIRSTGQLEELGHDPYLLICLKAEAHLMLREYDQSLRCIDTALKLHPGSIELSCLKLYLIHKLDDMPATEIFWKSLKASRNFRVLLEFAHASYKNEEVMFFRKRPELRKSSFLSLFAQIGGYSKKNWSSLQVRPIHDIFHVFYCLASFLKWMGDLRNAEKFYILCGKFPDHRYQPVQFGWLEAGKAAKSNGHLPRATLHFKRAASLSPSGDHRAMDELERLSPPKKVANGGAC